MHKLKEAYNIKKEILKDITNLSVFGDCLKENSNLKTIDINPDNTIYLESECGVDSIKHDLDEGIKKWLQFDEYYKRNIIFNVLPLTNNSCIVRI
jgi:hypothetical protein